MLLTRTPIGFALVIPVAIEFSGLVPRGYALALRRPENPIAMGIANLRKEFAIS